MESLDRWQGYVRAVLADKIADQLTSKLDAVNADHETRNDTMSLVSDVVDFVVAGASAKRSIAFGKAEIEVSCDENGNLSIELVNTKRLGSKIIDAIFNQIEPEPYVDMIDLIERDIKSVVQIYNNSRVGDTFYHVRLEQHKLSLTKVDDGLVRVNHEIQDVIADDLDIENFKWHTANKQSDDYIQVEYRLQDGSDIYVCLKIAEIEQP